MARVLFVTHLSDWGGAQKCLYLLLKGLPRETFEPIVVAPREGELTGRIRDLGITVRCSPMEWWLAGKGDESVQFRNFMARLERRVTGIAQIIQQERVDLVFTNTVAIADAAIAARRCGIPHVWHVLEMLSRNPGLAACGRLHSLYGVIQCLSDQVVAVSEAVKRELERYVPQSPIEVIRTGLPDSAPGTSPGRQALLGIPPENPVILFTGWLSRRKGVLDLIDAAELVLRERPQATFVLAGPDGGCGAEVSRRIRECGRQDSIQLLGFRGDICDLLSVADLAVVPSLADPLPLAVLEAMRAGLAVVATRSGGSEEMVVNGQTGMLVPVGAPQAMADGMIALLDDPRRRADMGRNARTRFEEHFAYERYIRQFVHLFQHVLSQEGTTPSKDCRGDAHCIQELLQDVAEGRAVLASIRSQLAERQRELTRAAAELSWMKKSLVWRLRNGAAAIPGLRQIAEYLGRRNVR